jgi:hypothetical protein
MKSIPGRPGHGRRSPAATARADAAAAQRFALASDTVTAAGTVLPVCGQGRPPWGRNPASARTLECIRPGPEGPLTDVKDGPVMSTDTSMQLDIEVACVATI